MNAKKNTSNTNCCVYNCNSVRRKNVDLSFHYFPIASKGKVEFQNVCGNVEVIDRRKAWIIKLKMGKKVSKHMQVCSLHFTKEDYYYADWRGSRRLLPNAVPSQNLPNRSHECAVAKQKIKHAQSAARSKRAISRVSTSTQSSSAHTVHNPSLDETHSSRVANQEEEMQLCAAKTLLLLSESTPMVNQCNLPLEQEELATDEEKIVAAGLLNMADIPFSLTSDKSTQVKSDDIITPFINLINTDKKLSSMTGLTNFELLNVIVELCKKCSVDKRIHKLSLKERIVLTLMKMKTGLTYAIISILFNTVSSNTCITIFFNTVMLMHRALKYSIRWPSSEEIMKNMPYCFLDFQNVRVVIDCIEVPIMKPKCLCCRIKSYSHYKGTNTIKFMTGVSPAGIITFISKGYGGRASDKVIFEQRGLIKKLNMCIDHIMLDKGFRIEEIAQNHGIKVIQPPFLTNKKQFTKDEALSNVQIAKARVHIERSNQRIKVFKIFNTALPLSLLPIADELFTVTCAIVNMSSPILAEDKFIKTSDTTI